ncbi:MAG TPA: UdgX family uracil-DNA binding protein [Chthoniobacterales bacterium]|nr:UdgX family uracil-DNA binding protein [Chthoniobacterales bacterium]
MEQITFRPTFEDWQRAARAALKRGSAPDALIWQELSSEQPGLDIFDEVVPDSPSPAKSHFRVPKAFFELARLVALHRDESRWALLYRMVWRLTHGEPKLLEIAVDPDCARAADWHKSVRHDIHKMGAFVRFREVRHAAGSWFVAWFEPTHHIVEQNAHFFVDRFASMHWSILTPERCAHWDGNELRFTAGVDKSQAPGEDNVESLWLTYYANIFNPARVKVHAMQAEMPKKYWRNLPEAVLIPALLQEAPQRVEAMVKKSAAKKIENDEETWRPAPVPETKDLAAVAAAAQGCTACHLYRRATQTVFGEGPKRARLILLGEQPGDQEDLAGKPFVGPSGMLLDRALEEAGIDRDDVYVTNTVKHFKWEPRGKRRLHQKPNSREIAACRPWLEAELRLVQPKLLVCLGATAAQAIFGSSFRVTKERGKVQESEIAPRVLATVHPSSLLRQPDEESRAREYALFLADLRVAAKAVNGK